MKGEQLTGVGYADIVPDCQVKCCSYLVFHGVGLGMIEVPVSEGSRIKQLVSAFPQ